MAATLIPNNTAPCMDATSHESQPSSRASTNPRPPIRIVSANPEQKRFLLMTLEESTQLDTEVNELVSAWQAGDTDALARMLTDEFDDFPELYRPLTEDRNRAWVEQLDDLLDDRDDYLVVVGALHLVGRNSVVDLLRQRGYTVTRQ